MVKSFNINFVSIAEDREILFRVRRRFIDSDRALYNPFNLNNYVVTNVPITEDFIISDNYCIEVPSHYTHITFRRYFPNDLLASASPPLGMAHTLNYDKDAYLATFTMVNNEMGTTIYKPEYNKEIIVFRLP